MVQPNGVSLSSFWTNRLGGKVTDWQLQWLDRERAFWKFLPSLFLLGKAHPWSWSVSLRSMPRASPLPPFFYIKVDGPLSATFVNCRGRNRTLGCFPFSFCLFSPQRGCTAARNKRRHTGAFDSSPFFFFFPWSPSRMDSLSALGN